MYMYCNYIVLLCNKEIKIMNPTSRTGYLRSLRDCVGPPPDDCMEKWREEWVKLRTEEYLRSDDPADKDKGTEEYVRENKDLDSVLTKFARGIKESVDSGMDPKHAEIYYALQSVRGSLAAAMREGRKDYVCSTYALSEALSSEYDLQKKLALPPSLYKNLEGKFGLASDDSQWSSIRTPDEAGFRGLAPRRWSWCAPHPTPGLLSISAQPASQRSPSPTSGKRPPRLL